MKGKSAEIGKFLFFLNNNDNQEACKREQRATGIVPSLYPEEIKYKKTEKM